MIDATKTSVIRNADIALVLLWQLIFLHQIPTLWSTIGLILIIICTLISIAAKSSPLPSATNNNETLHPNQIEIELESIEIKEEGENSEESMGQKIE